MKRVAKAFDDLDKQGRKATLSAVQEMTGGSFRDVTPAVREVKAAREARLEAARAVPEMPEAVAEAASVLWETAYRLADDVAASERRGHAEVVSGLTDQVAEMQEIAAKLEADHEVEKSQLTEARDAALKQVAIQQGEVDELGRRIRSLEIRNAQLEGRLAERDDERARRADVAKAAAGNAVVVPHAGQPATDQRETSRL